MNEKNALIISVVVLCFIVVLVTSIPSVAILAPTYVMFLSWASFFCAGGDRKGMSSSIITNICGALWGYVGVKFLLPLFGFVGMTLALPLAISIVAGGMIVQSRFKIFEFVPGCFIGCASFFAVANSTFIGPNGLEVILTASIIGLLAGDIIGYLSVVIVGLITKRESTDNTTSNELIEA